MQADPFDDDRTVSTYENWYATPFGQTADRVERAMLADLLPAPPGRLLEIGCGTGWFGSALSRRGWWVSGADRSAAMLARARERFPVARADAARLPFPDDAFDAALVVAVLDFVDSPATVLAEALRVAPRAAVLALSRRSCLGLWRRLAARRGHPIFSRARFWSASELRGFVRAAGARVTRVRTGLFLPPALAARLPALELAAARRSLPGAGLLGLALERPGTPGPRSPAAAPSCGDDSAEPTRLAPRSGP